MEYTHEPSKDPNTMKTSLLLLGTLMMLSTACTKEKAKVTFANNSTSNKVYNVVWDGAVICTLYPFTKSEEFEVEPGAHTIEFKFSNGGGTACAKATPVLSEGDSRLLSCSN